MKSEPSPYLGIIENILSGLAKVRMDSNGWLDSESEEQGKESQVFKIAESLRPFYLTSKFVPQHFEHLALPRDLLIRDSEFVLRQVAKEGFFPSPYSPIPGSRGSLDQYTDFAAFMLEFCALTHEFWNRQTGTVAKRIAALSKSLGEKAIDFLTSADNCLVDDHGCRWGGTKKFKRKKRTVELYTDTYFTSLVVLALNKALTYDFLELPQATKDLMEERVDQGVRWIADRFDGKFITGDEQKVNRKLLYTTWGLKALLDTYNNPHKPVKKGLLEAITNVYIEALRDPKSPTQQQEYLTVLSDEVDPPLYYEDRSGLGGIILTVASLSDVPDLEHLLDETGYTRLVERILNTILGQRDASSGLWYNNQLILSIHSYLVEALLLLHRRGDGFSSRLQITGYMVRTALKETFMDDSMITILQQAIYERLLGLLDSAEKNHTIDVGMHGTSKGKQPFQKTPRPGSSKVSASRADNTRKRPKK
jgi:hypothetical protein